jgi:fumarylacetoacetase
MAEASRSGLFSADAARAGARCAAGSLNGLISLGDAAVRALRRQLSRLLQADTDEGARARRLRSALLHAQADVEMALPAEVGDYSDFYASIHHATNVGTMLRPEAPLLPNYKWVPIGYHGRASSLVVSGTPIRRPRGQTSPEGNGHPQFGPTARLDYEAEVGFLIGAGNPLGEPIAIADAERHLAGLCLVNDWSARDIQAWEYQPLGPFLGKSFATTLSPWVVTRDALEPFRAPAAVRPDGDPMALPYLASAENSARGGILLSIEVHLQSARMREENRAAVRLSRGMLAEMYWTPAQLVTHHASNGCNLRPGDLLASGTVSGASSDSYGSMLELTWRGTKPLTLPSGEERRFLEDGDEVALSASCEREGFARIGFGECRGRILPAA